MVQQTITSTPTSTTTTYQQTCPNRLPCGVCRLLMMNCPNQLYTAYPTWTCKSETTGQMMGESK